MTNTLIKLNTASELIGYEALALAFVLASFEQDVALYLGADCLALFTDTGNRAYGMIQSLALYDIPKAYADAALINAQLDDKILASLQADDRLDESSFQHVLTF